MIRILAEVTADLSYSGYGGDPSYRVHLRIRQEGPGGFEANVQKVMMPEELYTSSIFDRVFDHMKDQLLREFEKQTRLRNSVDS